MRVIALCALLCPPLSFAADKDKDAAHPLASMPLRLIGPAYTSGRISDFAFHPERKHEFYVGVASGGLWVTRDGTNTWTPLFDQQASFAIGVVELDPSRPLTVWVGTGENNAQRSVAAGDGVYKSEDGGKTWSNVGLKDSGHISQIWIDPADGDHVLVAAQGPLWSAGGDRGLYRTRDGGKSWDRILEIDEHTGVNEFVIDPADSDHIVASSYQRRRHVWTLINGGPGSGIHRTTDGGKTWKRIERGLPKDHMGRIGLAGAPSAPNMIYAIIEASDEEKGIYRSEDFGISWEKRADYLASSPQYYNELIVDPLDAERVYSMDTFTHKTEDGGKTWHKLSFEHKHVDDHALWIDPDNTEHLIIGGDGGIYESWDRGNSWRHVPNLPVTQFYRIQPDNAEPFYNVCGGTQDNNSLCAPSRTTRIHGITNSDWQTILGGDGYKPQFDPRDPNVIYAQYQYGGLARYDRRTGERVYIAPHPGPDEPTPKWNWNTPLLVSPHAPERIYYGAERLYQSDNRGDDWRVISPDLTRQLDRNQLEVMDRVWSVDTIAKNDSTSRYGSAIGLSESPLVEGLIYVGTDDGVISVTEDGGATWRRTEKFRGVPDMAYVDDLIASVHDANVAYAVIDNHKRGDFKPYVLRSDNRGKSWRLISKGLPERGFAHTIAEDHEDPNLLFVGTELGLYFSQDRGKNWHKFSGLPTIAVRDIEIQRRETDLVVGTFGRGIYIIDDYSPLRTSQQALKQSPVTAFPVKDAWIYIEGDFFDDRVRGSRGAGFWRAENPPGGAVVSYYLRDAIEPRKKQRRKAEIKKEKDGKDTPYPSWDELRREDREVAPTVFLRIRDAEGHRLADVPAKAEAGFHRVSWDMRLPAPDPVNLNPDPNPPYWVSPPMGPLALPGEYSAQLYQRVEGVESALAEPQSFRLKPLDQGLEKSRDRQSLHRYQSSAADLYRQVSGAAKRVAELDAQILELREALRLTTGDTMALRHRLDKLAAKLDSAKIVLLGDTSVTGRNESAPWPLLSRANWIHAAHVESQSAAPGHYQESLQIGRTQFSGLQQALADIDAGLQALTAEAHAAGAPWTSGRAIRPQGGQ